MTSIGPGASVSHFRVLKKLGSGGMGEVFLANDTTLHRLVALKLLPFNRSNRQLKLRFIREARSASAINHPNVATIYEVGEVNGVSFIAMEYVEGVTLDEAARSGVLKLSDIPTVALKLANALQAAHEKGIVHRDIKPNNAIITHAGEVKLLDFGLAKQVQTDSMPTAITATGTVLGTFKYMSPEQAEGHEVDNRSDIYSLGVLVGELVFQMKGRMAPGLERVVRICQERDPSFRYQSAKDLISDLQNLSQVQTVESALDANGSTKVDKTDRSRCNFPNQLTSFIGRGADIAAVRRLLQSKRLVSLTGLGGVGKTRLALQIAEESLNDFNDGVWFVDLAPLTEPSLVPHAIAAALKIRVEAGVAFVDGVVEYLKSRNLLLLLDNCEHMIDACAHLVERWLKGSPKLHILLTSRESLGIGGEAVYVVPPMLSEDCIELFVARARSVQSNFGDSPNSENYISDICQHLDGIPLAIELAAARVKVISVEQIRARLRDRFGLLSSGSRTASPRHETLRAMLDSSHQLLSDGERILFRRLCIFAGTFGLEAVETICADSKITGDQILSLLSRLVDKSLVNVYSSSTQTRYRLLETIREYSRIWLEQTGEFLQIRNSYLEYFVKLAGEADVQLRGREQATWLALLDLEHDNIRSILTWSHDLRLAAAAVRYWQIRGNLDEGRRWLAIVLSDAAQSDATADRAKALKGAADLAYLQADYDEARSLCAQRLEICNKLGEKQGIAEALHMLGVIAGQTGDYTTAERLFEESLGLRRELHDQRGIAVCLNALGVVATNRGEYHSAKRFYEESTEIFKNLDDRRSIAASLVNLGLVESTEGNYDRAELLLHQALSIRRELGDKPGTCFALIGAGILECNRRDTDRAVPFLKDAINLCRELNNRANTAWAVEGFAALATLKRDFEVAAQLLSAAEALRKAVGVPRSAPEASLYERILKDTQGNLEPEILSKAWNRGRGLSLDQVIAVAMLES